jgi:hypothetical protein
MLGRRCCQSAREDFEKADDLLYAHERRKVACWLGRCTGGDLREHGLDADDVRRMAGTEAFKPMREGMAPDAAYLAAMQAGLAQLAEAE